MDERPNEAKRLIKVREAACILNESIPRTYQIARGLLPKGVVVHIGRQVRFDKEALLEWIANGGSR